MAAKEQLQCEIHNDKHLSVVCTACNKVMCSHCTKSGHHGHPIRDIKLFAKEVRDGSAQKKNELEIKMSEVAMWKRKHRQLRKDFDLSVKHTKEDIKARGHMLIAWINKHVEKKIAAVDKFAEERGRRELTRNISDATTRLQALSTHKVELMHILNQDISDVQIAKMTTAATDEEDRSRISAVYAHLATVPPYKSHIYLPDTSPVNWKQGLRDFIGDPGIAQTSNKLSHRSKLAVAHRVTCSTDLKAEVLGLHVLKDGRLCVAVLCGETDTNERTIHLKILDVTGKNVLQDVTLPFVTKKIRLAETESGTQLIAASGYTGEKKIIDLQPPVEVKPADRSGKSRPAKVCTLKRDPSEAGNIISKIRRKTSNTKKDQINKVFEMGAEDSKVLFSAHAEDPQTVVADRSLHYFAVIQIEKVLDSADRHFSEMPSVVLFERPFESSSEKHGHVKTLQPMFEPVRTERRNFFPSDLCFYSYKSREVLIVADLANNALYKVDYQTIGSVLNCLMTDCPLLDMPTALTTDHLGRLVVGCKGGSILTLVPLNDICGDYETPTTSVFDDDSSEYEGGGGAQDDEDDDDEDDSFILEEHRASGESGYDGSHTDSVMLRESTFSESSCSSASDRGGSYSSNTELSSSGGTELPSPCSGSDFNPVDEFRRRSASFPSGRQPPSSTVVTERRSRRGAAGHGHPMGTTVEDYEGVGHQHRQASYVAMDPCSDAPPLPPKARTFSASSSELTEEDRRSPLPTQRQHIGEAPGQSPSPLAGTPSSSAADQAACRSPQPPKTLPHSVGSVSSTSSSVSESEAPPLTPSSPRQSDSALETSADQAPPRPPPPRSAGTAREGQEGMPSLPPPLSPDELQRMSLAQCKDKGLPPPIPPHTYTRERSGSDANAKGRGQRFEALPNKPGTLSMSPRLACSNPSLVAQLSPEQGEDKDLPPVSPRQRRQPGAVSGSSRPEPDKAALHMSAYVFLPTRDSPQSPPARPNPQVGGPSVAGHQPTPRADEQGNDTPPPRPRSISERAKMFQQH